ncbi:hypothetical protein [Nitratireductor indicus]|uniref:hypothetical protein n=1 Tax=Nitratireductor indicus TaxID=721133 RepID=UPI0028758128|nr:hypothetical protein [Nitratireductor indicus]MDS1138196.1 hypothetical protein [Nitratireductor indicus]
MTSISDSSPRIYVACLAAYNNGYLHGASPTDENMFVCPHIRTGAPKTTNVTKKTTKE